MQRPSVHPRGIAIGVWAAVIVLLLGSCSAEEPATSTSPTAEPTPEPTASPTLSAELMDRRWTILYVGIDRNAHREAAGEPINTDALMLVSLSADQSELTLVSLPHDTVDVPLADGTTYPRKINALYADQGMETLVGAMETLYGTEIDGHVLLDMDDFGSLVDAVDGVEVSPEEPLEFLDLPFGKAEIPFRGVDISSAERCPCLAHQVLHAFPGSDHVASHSHALAVLLLLDSLHA